VKSYFLQFGGEKGKFLGWWQANGQSEVNEWCKGWEKRVNMLTEKGGGDRIEAAKFLWRMLNDVGNFFGRGWFKL
jgi:hypothetical protein